MSSYSFITKMTYLVKLYLLFRNDLKLLFDNINLLSRLKAPEFPLWVLLILIAEKIYNKKIEDI